MSADASTAVALAVDLDGTLVRSDLFLESALALLRQSPLAFFPMLLWLFSGRAVLKQRISERVSIDPSVLPYLEEVLQYVRSAQAAGRRTILATGSDRNLVQPVADYLGCFDAVFASDGQHNRTGRSKARQLTDAFGQSGFDYIGNSLIDIPVWRNARFALLAARSGRFSRQLGERIALERVFYYPSAGWMTWAEQLHLRLWPGNALVFASVLLGPGAFEPAVWLAALTAMLVLNLCSSGMAMGFDLLNLSVDRQHPQRREGPLATGRIYLASALPVVPALLFAGLLLALQLPGAFSWVLGFYVLALVLCCTREPSTGLAMSGFVLLWASRLLAGSAAVGISFSQWLEVLPQ